MKNHTYFVIFLFSRVAVISVFNYLAWKRKHFQQFIDLCGFEISNLDLALKDIPLPSRSCALPDTVCKGVSVDGFLVFITLFFSLEVLEWIHEIRSEWTMRV